VSADDSRRSAIVVGAGPVGLGAAPGARRRWASPRPCSSRAARPRAPRAAARSNVHGSTLRLLESMCPGLGERLAEPGWLADTPHVVAGTRSLFPHVQRTAPDGLPHFSGSLPQTAVEGLCSTPAGTPKDRDRVGLSAVTGVEPRVDGSIAHDRVAPLARRLLVGADVALHVRQAIGVEMEGSRSRTRNVIVDVAEDGADRCRS